LLIGELQEPDDIKLLDRHTSCVIELIKKTKKSISEKDETWIRLIISSYCHLKPEQLIQGFTKGLKLPARCSTVKDIYYYLTSSSVKEELKQMSKAKRSPIVLILDKVYSFIN